MAQRPASKREERQRKSTPQPPPMPRLSGAQITLLTVLDNGRKSVEAFGPAGGFLFAFAIFSWTFGSTNSRDELFRKVVFGKDGWAWPIAMGGLAITAVLWGYLKIRKDLTDSEEKKRLIAERNDWQERALGKKLHHTDGEDDGVAGEDHEK